MLNLNLDLGGALPGFSWGRLRLVFGGVGAEVEVEGMATAAWVDRLRSHAGDQAVASGLGLPGRWLGGERSAGRA